MKSNRWISIGAFFAIIIGGSLAFWWVEDGWTWFDALYMTIISVTTVGYGEVQPLSSAGRIVAIIVLITGFSVFGLVVSQLTSYAVGGTLEGSFIRRRTAASAKKLEGHTVICGLGDRGHSLSLGKDQCVVIEPDSQRPSVIETKSRKGLVLHGDATRIEHLRMSGAWRAKQIIVAAGDDNYNLTIAQTIRQNLGPNNIVPVIAAVEDYSTRDSLSDSLYQQGIHLFGFSEQSLLRLGQTMALKLVKYWKEIPTEPLKIIIQIEGCILQEVIRVFGMIFQFGGRYKLVIEVYGISNQDREAFAARFPEYDRCCEIIWIEKEFSFTSATDTPPDLAFFYANSFPRGIELAYRCLRVYPEIPIGRIHACFGHCGKSADLSHIKIDPETGLTAFSLYDLLAKENDLVSYAMDKDGRRLHEAYLSNTKQTHPSWEELTEFQRNSNRFAAFQRKINRGIALSCSEGSQRLAIIEYLAECEHLRWMAHHLMCGYRLDTHDRPKEQWQSLKVHPKLVSYEELSEADRDKDRTIVCSALDLSEV